MDKQQRRAKLKEWKIAERADLRAGMPMTPQQLARLMDHLGSRYFSCKHTSQFTEQFLEAENLDKDVVLHWLEDRGGYCDCSVVEHLHEFSQSVLEPAAAPPRFIPEKKAKPAARSLRTVTGWNLSDLPKPWRIANLHVSNEPIRIELGKNGGCTIDIIESPVPDPSLSRGRTGIPVSYENEDWQTSHGVLDLPDGLQSTLVCSQSWRPAYCWVVPEAGDWYLMVRTDVTRQAGDLPQISRLISHLARS